MIKAISESALLSRSVPSLELAPSLMLHPMLGTSCLCYLA